MRTHKWHRQPINENTYLKCSMHFLSSRSHLEVLIYECGKNLWAIYTQMRISFVYTNERQPINVNMMLYFHLCIICVSFVSQKNFSFMGGVSQLKQTNVNFFICLSFISHMSIIYIYKANRQMRITHLCMLTCYIFLICRSFVHLKFK